MTTMTRSSDRATEIHTELMTAVRDLTTSQEWLDAMTAAARFHNYSLGNWLLIWAQAEQRGVPVSQIAGYRRWQELGRQVRKGEHGYVILAPMVVRRRDDSDGTDDRLLVGFRTVTVFDVAQTDGDDLPTIEPVLLDGDDTTILERVATVVRDLGWSFTRSDLASTGANGYTKRSDRAVVVHDGLSGAAASKTALHELAHVLLHASDDDRDCRGTREVEAESAAYVVARLLNLDTAAYSIPYVALWADQTSDPAGAMLRTGERVVTTARKIVGLLAGQGEETE